LDAAPATDRASPKRGGERKAEEPELAELTTYGGKSDSGCTHAAHRPIDNRVEVI